MNTFTKIFSLVVMAVAFSACAKDEGFEDGKYGMDGIDKYKVVNIPSTNTTLTTSGTYPAVGGDPAAPVVLTVPVHLSAQDKAKETLNVTLSVDNDDAKINAYNASITTTPKYIRMPTSAYTVSNGGIATIPQGGRDGSITVTVVPSSLTSGVRYIIPLSINSIDKSGYTISGNQGYRLILVTRR